MRKKNSQRKKTMNLRSPESAEKKQELKKHTRKKMMRTSIQ